MTWTYDPALLNDATVGTRYQVRLEIGDTDSTEPLIQDQEIDYYLTQEGSVYFTAARCADAVAARYAREADLAVGGLRSSLSQVSKRYESLARAIRSKASRYVAPYAGGISVADKQTVASDTDRVSPAFYVDMERNFGAPSPTDQPIEDVD